MRRHIVHNLFWELIREVGKWTKLCEEAKYMTLSSSKCFLQSDLNLASSKKKRKFELFESIFAIFSLSVYDFILPMQKGKYFIHISQVLIWRQSNGKCSVVQVFILTMSCAALRAADLGLSGQDAFRARTFWAGITEKRHVGGVTTNL